MAHGTKVDINHLYRNWERDYSQIKDIKQLSRFPEEVSHGGAALGSMYADAKTPASGHPCRRVRLPCKVSTKESLKTRNEPDLCYVLKV